MAAVVLALALAVPSAEASVQVRASAGAEVDTNARRAVSVSAADSEVVTDGLVRVTAEVEGQVRGRGGHFLVGQFGVGAKRFVEEDTEDLLAFRAQLQGRLSLGRGWFLGARGWGRLSRIRNRRRDYELGEMTAELGWRRGPFEAAAFGGGSAFGFGIEPRFDYVGLAAGGRIGWRPVPELSLNLQGGFRLRDYSGNALVVSVPVDGDQPPRRTFCEDPEAELARGFRCTPRNRQDDEARVGASIRWVGDFLVELGYLVRVQRSTSELENVDRHRISLMATFALPARLDLGFRGGLQINDSVTLTDRAFLAEADENQNVLQFHLQRPIEGPVTAELRYALFANQFADVAAEFIRHTVYAGLIVEL
ncbi:MAG: hypothetical protein AAFZ18_07880 [Myxococcota bacterium]